MDPFGRTIDYLRISVTDRCNQRCLYCMPHGYKGWQNARDLLSLEQILRIVHAAAALGFRKYRITGGEPLVRDDIPELVRQMLEIPGVHRVGLSTNGMRLAPQITALKQAGLSTVNISLDALSPEVYRRITGRPIEPVLEGIRAAVSAGFERVKLNAVLLRGINEAEIRPLIAFAAELDVPLRLIELMPVSQTGRVDHEHYLSVEEVMARLRQEEPIIPQPNLRLDYGPAKYYRLAETGALVGFIGAMTTQHFCDTCNCLRLTADGRIRPCLGNTGEVDLRDVLRQPDLDSALTARLLRAIASKPAAHQFCGDYHGDRPMTAIGG